MLRTILSNATIITPADDDSSKSFYVLYLKFNQDVEPPSHYVSPAMDWAAYGRKNESYPLCISRNFERLRDLQAILKYFKPSKKVFKPLIDTFENFNQYLPNCSLDEDRANFYFGDGYVYIDHFYFSTIFNRRDDSLILPIEDAGPVLIRCLKN